MFGVRRGGGSAGNGAPGGGSSGTGGNAGGGTTGGGSSGEGGAGGGTAGSTPGGTPDQPGQAGPTKVGQGSGWILRTRGRQIALAAAAVGVVAAAGTYVLVSPSHAKHTAQETAQPAPARPGSFKVAWISPGRSAGRANGASPITVSFNAPVAPNTPQPQLKPAVPGTWTESGNVMTFTPATPFAPDQKITVLVPAGATGVHSAAGVTLTKEVSDNFTTAGYSSLRMAQILAQLGYLPLTWTPGAQGTMAQAERATNAPAQTQIDMAYSPPPGTFSWESGYPSLIRSIWTPNRPNEMITGAIMAFEAQHGMTLDETPTHRFWKVLFQADKQQNRNKVGYTYAIASKALPETLTIWHDGRIVEHTLANTGIPVSPTVDGTFPVYEKFRFQIMRGTNPDGSSYADPVSWVSYFNGGDAVHYFPRGSYGFQQSLGCVELPYNSAEQSYPYLTYGSLVTVTG